MDRERFPWPSYMWLPVAIMCGIIWLCKKAYMLIWRGIEGLRRV